MNNATTNNTTPDTINIGDRVRSFDFASRGDCYAEGVVTAIGLPPRGAANVGIDLYTIAVERTVFAGEIVDGPAEVWAPINGIPKTFGGVTDGVVKL